MSGGEGPILAQRIIYTALAMLASVVILSMAVALLRSIMPWLIGLILLVAAGVGAKLYVNYRNTHW